MEGEPGGCCGDVGGRAVHDGEVKKGGCVWAMWELLELERIEGVWGLPRKEFSVRSFFSSSSAPLCFNGATALDHLFFQVVALDMAW